MGRSSTRGKQTDGKKRILVIAITSRAQSAALVSWSSIVNVAFDGSS
jgi:hypothetical protein